MLHLQVGLSLTIRTSQFASIFRQVAREKRRHSGAYVEAFRERAGGKAARNAGFE